jgi:antitoxin MazE
MTTLVSKWGNSLGIRISKAIAAAVKVGDGDEVDVRVQNGAIVIRPAVRRYTIEELVEGITPKNRHVDLDWRTPNGTEVW